MASSHRYSHHALRALQHAATLASGFQHAYQDTGHLLVGVILAEGSIGAQVMADLSLSPTIAGVYLKRLLPRVEDDLPKTLPRSSAFEEALKQAATESDWLGSHYIGTEHLLLGITRTTQPGNANELLRLVDISSEQIRRRIRLLVSDQKAGFSLDSVRANARLSEVARRVLNAAEQMALSLEHSTVSMGHVLWALAQERRSVTSDILRRSGLNDALLRTALDRREAMRFGKLEIVIQEAVERAEKLGSHYVGADHLLLALTLLPAGVALLQTYGASADKVNRLLNKHLTG
jgi:ATP-dependent Clp protease ATP-binding subunit ClpA